MNFIGAFEPSLPTVGFKDLFRRTVIKELIGMTIRKADQDRVVEAKTRSVIFMPIWMLMNIYSKLTQVKISNFNEKLDFEFRYTI